MNIMDEITKWVNKSKDELIMVQPEKVNFTFERSGNNLVFSDCSYTPKRPSNSVVERRRFKVGAKRSTGVDTVMDAMSNLLGEMNFNPDENTNIARSLFSVRNKVKTKKIEDQYLIGIVNPLPNDNKKQNQNKSLVSNRDIEINIQPKSFTDGSNQCVMAYEKKTVSVLEELLPYFLDTRICFLKVDYEISGYEGIATSKTTIKEIYPLTKAGFDSLHWLIPKTLLGLYENMNSLTAPYEFALILYRLIELREDGVKIRYVDINSSKTIKPVVAVINGKRDFGDPTAEINKFINELSKISGTVPVLLSREIGTTGCSLEYHIPENADGMNQYGASVKITVSVFPDERNLFEIFMPLKKDSNNRYCIIRKKCVSVSSVLDEYYLFIEKYKKLKLNGYKLVVEELKKGNEMYKKIEKYLGKKNAKAISQSLKDTSSMGLFKDFITEVRKNTNTDYPELYLDFLDYTINSYEEV